MRNKPTVLVLVLVALLTIVLHPSYAWAAGESAMYYYYEDEVHAVNTGLDNGYTGASGIGHEDLHFGWGLGSFYVTGFTRQTTVDGRTVYLKNVGDTVTLGFRLDQDINQLNGDQTLSIARDENGYDERLGVPQTDFGRGTLVIRKTDYQNHVEDAQVYCDYLEGVEVGALTQIDLLEEGDYEVALNYEVREDPRIVLGISVLPHFESYRLEFNFSIRNGNCMVYPFDVTTGSELTNAAFTESGFYLDLAYSRYLEVNVIRQVLDDSGTELVEDTRFNRPARDGEQYTEEGVYVIEVTNPSTGQSTTKTIYVGTDPLLRSHAATGRPIGEIQEMVDEGAEIADDGTIVSQSGVVIAPQEESEIVERTPTLSFNQEANSSQIADDSAKRAPAGSVVVVVVIVVVVVLAVLIRARDEKKAGE